MSESEGRKRLAASEGGGAYLGPEHVEAGLGQQVHQQLERHVGARPPHAARVVQRRARRLVHAVRRLAHVPRPWGGGRGALGSTTLLLCYPTGGVDSL